MDHHGPNTKQESFILNYKPDFKELYTYLDCNTIEENCIYCSGIDELYINGNQLSGELPDNLCNLRCVTFLDMSDNQFCGPYPVCDYFVYWGGYNLIDETQQDISNCPTCSSEYTEIDGACYNNDDLNFLQSLIDNSQNTSSSDVFNENPPSANMEPINLGSQVWQDLEDDIWPTNRLVEFCSSNNESNGTCYSEYILSGDVPSLVELDGLLHLDLRNNKLSDIESFNETSNLEYLYLSNNLFDNFPGSIYNMSNLMELWISDNNLNTIDETNETCDFFSSLSSYTLDGNYICSGNAPSCITISNQNTINCCAESLGSEYIDYLGECYFESDLDVINNISQSIFNVSAIWSDYRVVELNLSNNQ